MPTHAQSDDFDIAKGIFEQLKDLPAERQQRVLRWIAEGLGVPPVGPPTPYGGGTPPLPAGGGTPSPPAGGGAGPSNIKSFVAAKAPKSDQQFAATVAYYFRFEASPAERRDSINGELLQGATRLAGRNRLANPHYTLKNAKAAGYLDSISRGEFTINSVGENLVAMTLPSGKDTSAKKRKPAKSQRKTKSTKRNR